MVRLGSKAARLLCPTLLIFPKLVADKNRRDGFLKIASTLLLLVGIRNARDISEAKPCALVLTQILDAFIEWVRITHISFLRFAGKEGAERIGTIANSWTSIGTTICSIPANGWCAPWGCLNAIATSVTSTTFVEIPRRILVVPRRRKSLHHDTLRLFDLEGKTATR